jgi:hypothetical protein
MCLNISEDDMSERIKKVGLYIFDALLVIAAVYIFFR